MNRVLPILVLALFFVLFAIGVHALVEILAGIFIGIEPIGPTEDFYC